MWISQRTRFLIGPKPEIPSLLEGAKLCPRTHPSPIRANARTVDSIGVTCPDQAQRPAPASTALSCSEFIFDLFRGQASTSTGSQMRGGCQPGPLHTMVMKHPGPWSNPSQMPWAFVEARQSRAGAISFLRATIINEVFREIDFVLSVRSYPIALLPSVIAKHID